MKKVATEKKMVRVFVERLPGVPPEQQVIHIGHNFKNYTVRRGVEVLVPVGVAKRLEQYKQASYEADMENMRLAQMYPGGEPKR